MGSKLVIAAMNMNMNSLISNPSIMNNAKEKSDHSKTERASEIY